jgi:lipopolysaccharide export LptBFGC system permease protein LptF
MILQRYIFRELLATFLFAFAVVMAVCVVGTVFQTFRTVGGAGFEILAQVVPMAAGYAAPWAILVATCMTVTLVYGRLSAENEIDAMRMSGIHAARFIMPAFLLGLLLSAGSGWVNEEVAPAAYGSRARVARESVLRILRAPPPGSRKIGIGEFKLSYADFKDGKLDRPFLVKSNPQGLPEAEYHAVSGAFVLEEGKPPRLVMSKPALTLYAYDPSGREPAQVTRIDAESDVPVDLELPEESGLKKPRAMSREELAAAAEDPRYRRYRDEVLTLLHGRVAWSLAPLALVLVSVPIGVFVKKGSRLAGLGAALPPLLAYFVALFVFQSLGERGRLDAAAAAYSPVAILGLLAAVLMVGVFRR